MPTGPEAHDVDVGYPTFRVPLDDQHCPRSSGEAHRHLRPVFIALLATPLVSAPLPLPASSPRDAASRGIQAANDRSIVAYHAGDVSTYMHMPMFIMDTVVPGGEYDIRRLLEQMPPVDQAAAEYRAILRIACVGEGGRAAILDDAAAVAADYADNEPTGR